MTTFEKPGRCPECGYEFDAHDSVVLHDDAAEPKPGDVSLCVSYTRVFVFDEHLNLQKMTLPTWMALEDVDRLNIAKVQGTLARFRNVTGPLDSYLPGGRNA